MSTSQAPRSSRGFTLIELMIAVAVVAILVAVAYPSYLEQIRRANRTEAMEALSRVAVAQERFLFSYGRYSTAVGGDATSKNPAVRGLGLATTTPDGHYALTMTLDGPLAYTVTATPISSAQLDDRCGALTLSHTGKRDAAAERCWQ